MSYVSRIRNMDKIRTVRDLLRISLDQFGFNPNLLRNDRLNSGLVGLT